MSAEASQRTYLSIQAVYIWLVECVAYMFKHNDMTDAFKSYKWIKAYYADTYGMISED